MKFKSKVVVIEATRWFKNGDHPQDDCFRPYEYTGEIPKIGREGRVVRYYRHPNIDGSRPCISLIPCAHTMHDHGWIDTPEGGHNVCPGDWIITGLMGEHYPCKDVVFKQKYEPVVESEQGDG